jgi:hypothetical protein
MENLTQVNQVKATVALPQLTDAQLEAAGWTLGQVKEVRKYHKIAGHARNAHQRALCRRYSDAQVTAYPVDKAPVFTAKKTPKIKGVRRSSTKIRWSAEEFDLLIDLYLKNVDGLNGVENRDQVVSDFQTVFPDRSGSAVALGVCQIKGLDTYHPAKGMKDTSAMLISKLQEVDPNRFAA